MLKNLQSFVLSFMFQSYEMDEEGESIPVVIPINTKLLEDFKNTVIIWEIARELESEKQGKIICSFRENDGTMPLKINSESRGSFVLYVSKEGSNKILCSYEVKRVEEDRLSVFSERIHCVDNLDAPCIMYRDEAIGRISDDIDFQLT